MGWIDRWTRGWRPYLAISGVASGAMLWVMNNSVKISETPKLLPTATEVFKPVATAMMARATATPIPQKITEGFSAGLDVAGRIKTGGEYDLYIVLGVVGIATIAGVYFFGRAFLEGILGGPAVRMVAEEKSETLTGSVAITTEAPRELVKVLVSNGAKGKILAQHPDFPAYIDVKGVAPTLATREVLKDHPELLDEINKRSSEIEAQLTRKARLLN